MVDTDRPRVDLRMLLEHVDNGISVVGLVLNSLLLFLILNKTGPRLMDYRPIFIQNCLIDFFYNVVNCITKIQTDYKNGYFYILMTGPLAFMQTPWNMVLIITWVFAMMCCVTSIPVQFIYRYFLVCRGERMSKSAYSFLLASAIFFAVVYGIIATFTFYPDPELLPVATKLLEADSYYYAGIPNFGFSTIDSFKLKVLFVYCYSLCFLSYSITVFANIKVWRHLKQVKDNMSAQMRDVHRQITTTLAFQAVVPCIICLIPVVTAVTMTFLRANIPGVGICVSLVWSWIPVANPLLTIIVVRSYRNAVTLKIKTMWPTVSNTHSVVPIGAP